MRIARQLWIDGDWTPTTKPEIVRLDYAYDNVHNPLNRWYRRANDAVKRASRDEQYGYDGLNRLAQADRGTKDHSGGGFTPAGTRGQQWDLDALGNWSGFIQDTSGNGVYAAAEDFDETRAHNLVNEITGQTVDNTAWADAAYDAAGNLRLQQRAAGSAVWIYVYDAWNRLRRVEIDPDGVGTGNPPLMRAQYEYNGLHWRTRRGADADEAHDGVADEANLYYYDADWRLLEERIDDAPTSFSDYTDMDRVAQRFWSHRYIDEILYMRADSLDAAGAAGADGDFSNAKGYYFLCDRKYDVIAVLFDDAAALLAERVRYTPYGVARHRPLGDVNGDGVTNGSDQLLLFGSWGATIGSPSYDPDADFDRDGSNGPNDNTIYSANFGAGGLAEGKVSTVHNIIAYSGYVYDEGVDLHLSRYRWLDATTGRWLSRDPLDYLFGANLYEYTLSSPLSLTDPLGLYGLAGYWREFFDGLKWVFNPESFWPKDGYGPGTYPPRRDDGLNPFQRDVEDIERHYRESERRAYELLLEETKRGLHDSMIGLACAGFLTPASRGGGGVGKRPVTRPPRPSFWRSPKPPTVKPPNWKPNWRWGPSSRPSNDPSDWSWWDPNGGEWRLHYPDAHHPSPHWDFNPWTEWNSPWRNVPIS